MPKIYLSASNLTSGTIPDGRLSSNVLKLNEAYQTLTGHLVIQGTDAQISVVKDQDSHNILRSKKVGDTEHRFTLAANGTLQWGTGSGSLDVGLYRSVEGYLATDQNFRSGGFRGNGANITALNASNISSGTIDTARLPSDVVKTTGNQTIAGSKTFTDYTFFNSYIWRTVASDSETAYVIKNSNQTGWAFTQWGDGRLSWGPGTGNYANDMDISFARSAAGTLSLIGYGVAANASRLIVEDRITANYLVAKGSYKTGVASNLFTNSEDLPTALAYTSYSGTTYSTWTANAGVAPDGTSTADLLTESTANSVHIASRAGLTIGDGPHTYSIFVKPNGRTWVSLEIYTGISAFLTRFNLTGEGSIGSSGEYNGAADSGNKGHIEYVGNGWYRIGVTRTFVSTTSAQYSIYLATGDGTTRPSYTGDGTSGAYFWGAQIEPGSAMGPYVKTGASAATLSPLATTSFASNAANISSGTLADARLSSNVALLDTGANYQTWKSQQIYQGGYINTIMGQVGWTGYLTRVTGDQTHRFGIYGDGSFAWGDGTNATGQDVNLYRGGSNLLATDDGFRAGNLGAGTSDFSTASGSQLHVRVTKTGSENSVAILLSDTATSLTDGTYKAIRSTSNNGNSKSEIRFIESDGTNNNTAIGFATAFQAGSLREVVRITRDGRLGIGTNSPSEALDVVGSAKMSGELFVGNSGSSSERYVFFNGNPGNGFLRVGPTGFVVSSVTNGQPVVLRTQNTDRLTVGASGEVTIKSNDLYIGQAGDTTARFIFMNGNPGHGFLSASPSGIVLSSAASGQPIVFRTNDVEKVRITSDGKVGIGTDSPSEKLDVSGNIKSTYHYSTYTADGLFDTNAKPFKVTAGNLTGEAVIGYYSPGDGKYYPRLGFKAIFESKTISLGIKDSTGALTVEMGGSEKIRVLQDGKVGIGNTPTEALEVTGNIKASGTVKAQFMGVSTATVTYSASITWAVDTAQVAKVTLTGNPTMTATGMMDGGFYSILIVQDSTGSRTISWNTSVFKFAGGSAPVLSTAANAQDVIVFRSNGTQLLEVGRSMGVA